MKSIQVLVAFFLGSLSIGEACSPYQGFYVISNQPSKDRNSGDFYIYAFHTAGISSHEEIQFANEETGLAINGTETGEIRTSRKDLWGAYLRLSQHVNREESRFGTFIVSHSSGSSVNTFIRRKTKLLDTRGVFTVTVYPKTIGSTELADSDDNPINIACTFGCQTIEWFKDNRKLTNSGARLTLNSTEDAGLYTIRRRDRAKKHWFVQIEVIVASCPWLYYMDMESMTCAYRYRSNTCVNGGVPHNEKDTCTCPPYFTGLDCSFRVTQPPDLFALAKGQRDDLFCENLVGGNTECKGYLFCAGSLFGCKCFPGWHGNNCDKPCRKRKWGIECSQSCPRNKMHCNRFDGSPVGPLLQ